MHYGNVFICAVHGDQSRQSHREEASRVLLVFQWKKSFARAMVPVQSEQGHTAGTFSTFDVAFQAWVRPGNCI